MTPEWMDTIDVTFKADREFGFPTFIICAIGWWLHKAAGVLHSSVVMPVIRSHTDFMSVTQETLKGLGMTQERQAKTLQEISHSQREIVDAVKAIQPNGTR